MKKHPSILAMLAIGMALAAAPMAQASSAGSTNTKATPAAKKVQAKKAPAKKSIHSKKATPHKAVAASGDEPEPDVTGLVATDYNCELGNKITLHESATDQDHVALRWNKRLTQLTRVSTTTGAKRYENQKQGLVWIGIPAKGMLLDSKKGQQLANECKSSAQLALKAEPLPSGSAPLLAVDPATTPTIAGKQ